MKKTFLFALAYSASVFAFAHAEVEQDSLSLINLQELVVKSVKAPKFAPFAVTQLKKDEIQDFSRTGQELPFLLSRTPGVMAWSDNGLGIGPAYMRIRGAGDSRINVTLDGVSLNSPEDQCVFWANMNSYAALLGQIQVQRGVGTSTNGDGAFGGSVMLNTQTPSMTPGGEMTASYGSYGTYRTGLKASSGLIGGNFIIDAAYHRTSIDGYIHGTDGQSGSYYGGLTYINNQGNLRLSYKNIGNFERMGQAWNGVTAGNNDYSMNAYDGVRTYKDMYEKGLGKYNSLYEYFEPDWSGGWTIRRYQMADGTLWDKTTDNFWQNHNLLNMAWQIDEKWSTSATIHYTHGHGYYDEFRYQNKLKKFGLSNMTLSDGSTLKKTDFVRQKGLTQDTYGMLWNMHYDADKWDVRMGASFQNFEGNHWGYLTYVANEELRNAILTNGKYKYYDSDATKADNQLYVKGTYHVNPYLDVYGDVQYRHVGFMTGGINDKFYDEGSQYYNQVLDIKKKYDFLNPKTGITFHKDGHVAYTSYALSHREPERNNFTDNGAYPAPKAESVHDIEAGYSYTHRRFYIGANLYAMIYHNQFVQTGEVSDIGESLTTNINRSYRLGMELSAGVKVANWLNIEANAALSRNRIVDFTEFVEMYDDNWNDLAPTEIRYNNSTLAFSPSVITNGFVDFHHKGFKATWHTNFVSRQYLDNTACKERSLPEYSQTNIHLAYDWALNRKGLRNVVFGMQFNNIFDAHYAASGWVYSSIVGAGYPNESRYTQIGYVPMAGFTCMGNLTLKF